jgi:hypothetical protein
MLVHQQEQLYQLYIAYGMPVYAGTIPVAVVWLYGIGIYQMRFANNVKQVKIFTACAAWCAVGRVFFNSLFITVISDCQGQ